MSKVEVFGYRPVLDDVLEALQRAGMLEIDTAPEGLETEAVDADDQRRRRLEEYAADARFVREFLGRYHRPSQPLAAFVSEKFHLSVEEFEALGGGSSLEDLYRECEDLADSLASSERERARLLALVRDLEPWCDVRLPVTRWTGTEHVALFAGTVPSNDGERIHSVLRGVTSLTSVAEFGGAGARRAWIVLAHRGAVDEVRSALAATQFVEVTFAGLKDSPAEESARARARIVELESGIAGLKERARALSEKRHADAVAMVELVDSDIAAMVVRGRFGRTERAFVVRGWIRSSREQEMRTALAAWGTGLDIELSEPAIEDSPPVELDNPWWLRPFEVLTDLYGRPGYRELDPTPLLAPFFLLFFAICIGDVGYGAMLIGGAWLIKHRLDVAPTVKRFCDLMMFGGVGAMAIGVLLASYFALPVELLPSFLRALQVLDPLAQLQIFLVATIILGVLQVFFGVGIAAYDSFRRGDPGTAVFEQLSTIFLFVMIGVCAFGYSSGNAVLGRAALVIGLLGTMLMQGRTLEAALGEKDSPLPDRAFGWLWFAVMISWVAALAFSGPPAIGWGLLALTVVGLFASHAVRRCVVSFLGGVYAVYGMSAFLGDVLSYTRLAALGLSGALVGMVFNVLAGMVWVPVAGLWSGGGMGYVWAVVALVSAVAVFVVGHVFNVVINLLGAFVHPARLQFVEFFSKFYEGGGHPLVPFRFATKSVVLGAGTPGLKEGA